MKTLIAIPATLILIAAAHVSPASANTCVGSCGGYGDSCWCDSYCQDYGDCCSDYVPVCLGGGGDTSGGAPNRLGAVGDSISTGMDADADCDTLVDCAGRLGEDRGYSWTTGYSMSDSIRNKLGMTSTVEKQKNGARWQDAPGQAQAILDAGGASHVTLLLGGNDVCRGVNATLSTKAEIKAQIHTALTKLINASEDKRPEVIILGTAPNVVHLRDTMYSQKNFVFETCNDLWNLNTSAVEVNTCDWGFFDFLCDIADFIIEVTADFVSPLTSAMLNAFDVEFPCGYVLSNSSNATKRSLAAALNLDINHAIMEEVAEHQGANGVQILTDNYGIYNYQFTTSDVSKLDCFHPSRQGQKNIARTVYNNSGLGSTAAPTTDTGAPYMVGSSNEAWWVNYADIYFTFDTNENASMQVQVYNCNTGAWTNLGSTNETPTHHEFHVENLNYYYYWDVYVRPVDVAGNAGGWYHSGCM